MEIQDGFIVSIFNYCDRWCERCPFTNRCRVFADLAEMDFEKQNGPLTEPMHERRAKQLEQKDGKDWEKELGIDLDEISKQARENPEALELPEIKLEHLELSERAFDFSSHVFRWLGDRTSDEPSNREAFEVIVHFGFFVTTKIRRALLGIAQDKELGECSDAQGSAKAALIGLERLRNAWEQLVSTGYVPRSDVAALIDDVEWMAAELERVVPDARAFVRPGFDEPDEVKKLEAQELNP